MSLSTGRQAVLRIAVLALVLLASCGGGPKTSVTQVWKAPWSPPPMKSIIVFATHMDETSRRSVEDGLVASLAKHDTKVKPSYVFFPADPPEREQARAIVKEAGFDGILVTALKSVKEKQTYVPGSYGGGFWSSYYDRGWTSYTPGYVITDEIVVFETTLWDTRAADKLAFSMLTETPNPSAGPAFVKSVSRAVEAQLERTGLIPRALVQQ